MGKKTYNYSKPRSPYPPMYFPHFYVVDETEYRNKKAMAFQKRSVSHRARKWMMQRNAYIKYIIQREKKKDKGLTQEEVAKIPEKYGVECIEQRTISDILNELTELEGDV